MPAKNVRKSRVPKKAPPKETGVAAAVREVNKDMRDLKKVVDHHTRKSPATRMTWLKMRTERSKTISNAARKHGVKNKALIADKVINPAEELLWSVRNRPGVRYKGEQGEKQYRQDMKRNP